MHTCEGGADGRKRVWVVQCTRAGCRPTSSAARAAHLRPTQLRADRVVDGSSGVGQAGRRREGRLELGGAQYTGHTQSHTRGRAAGRQATAPCPTHGVGRPPCEEVRCADRRGNPAQVQGEVQGEQQHSARTAPTHVADAGWCAAYRGRRCTRRCTGPATGGNFYCSFASHRGPRHRHSTRASVSACLASSAAP